MKGALFFLLLLTGAASLSPDDFFVPTLPLYSGQEADLPTMYSGFLPVTEPADQADPDAALFFWLILKKNSTSETTTPLILWLNGGPGASSMTGLFT